MRLIDLEPRWVIGDRYDTPDGAQHFDLVGRSGMGVSFQCPVHGDQHRLAVFFQNPIDGLPPQYAQNLWKREDADFDALTLTPSIDASGVDAWPGCWHGFITNGNIV